MHPRCSSACRLRGRRAGDGAYVVDAPTAVPFCRRRDRRGTPHGAACVHSWSAEAEPSHRPRRLASPDRHASREGSCLCSAYTAAQDDAALLHSNSVTHVRSATAGADRTARATHFLYFLMRTLAHAEKTR